MKPGSGLEIGDVVQLGADVQNPAFAYCFMVVTEPYQWGAQGYVQALGTAQESGGQAYYRARWEDMDYVGKSVWHVVHDEVSQ